MKINIKITKEVYAAYVRIVVPVRYDEEDIPNNFPLRTGDKWGAVVNIDSGIIIDWPPQEEDKKLSMKVCDEGSYIILDEDFNILKKIQGYVPHELVPGSYGDYIELEINKEGRITNWETSAKEIEELINGEGDDD